MNKFKLSSKMRFFFLVSASIMTLGIWLTGFDTVHWLLYVPPAFFFFAVLTGICPGLVFSQWLFGEKAESNEP